MSDQLTSIGEAAPVAVQTPDGAAPTEIEVVGSEEQTPLSLEERSRLQDSEKVIEAGVGQFLAVGTALSEIKRDRLYREGFKTFKEYCNVRWQFGASYAYRLIDSAECVAQLKEAAGTEGLKALPTNEYQVRQLAKLKTPKSRVTAWNDAVTKADGDNVTAEIVEKVVRGKRRQSRKKQSTKSTGQNVEQKLESIGKLVNKELEKSSKLDSGIKKLLKQILDLTGFTDKSSK